MLAVDKTPAGTILCKTPLAEVTYSGFAATRVPTTRCYALGDRLHASMHVLLLKRSSIQGFGAKLLLEGTPRASTENGSFVNSAPFPD